MSDMIDATLEIAYFDARDARSDIPAQVTMDSRGMTLVAADENGEQILWHGERRGQGHYVLGTQQAGMDASLHRFADSMILEGFWRNGRERGFWRLHLPADAVLPKESRVIRPPASTFKARSKPARKRVRRAA